MQPFQGAGRRLAVALEQLAPGAVGLVRGDLLFQDRGDQRLQDQPRAPEPQSGVASVRLLHDAVARGELRGVVAGAEQIRQPVHQPLGPRPPRLRLDPAAPLQHP